MPVAATDLVAYAAVNMPTDDTSASGGAIDVDRRVVFTDLAANDDVEVISDDAGDTQNCTIVARKADGTVVSETLALTGLTAKIFAGNGIVERIQSVDLVSDAIGTITVRRSVAGATIGTIPAGERGFMRMFRNAIGEPGGGSPRIYHEKFFWKNNHGTLALLDTKVSESDDPTGDVTFALEDAVNDTGSVANRLAAPAAGDIGASGFVNTPTVLDMGTETDASTEDLAAGAAIGVWLKLTVPPGDAPYKDTYTSQISGNST